VLSVHDGDTATLETVEGRLLRIRFHGVDAPERATEQWPAQAQAAEATAFARRLLEHAQVRVRLTGARTYGREVGEIFVNGQSASHALVAAGRGWWSRKHAPDDRVLARLEAAARKARRGLWRDAAPEPPWRYRARHRYRAH
jgi:endonuclease YncB( thermonuclease family)